ncbi:MAG: phosphate ABC transporter substrate-binding protein [Dokdonella sp.]
MIVTATLLIAALPRASSAGELSGSLTCVGSDSVSALVTRWATAFHARHPLARIQVQAAGSGSAPLALNEGATDIGSMSRAMNERETADFRDRYGYEPTRIVIARDAVVVFVHPDNPIRRITIAELDAIYSTHRRCGAPKPIDRWADLDADADARSGLASLSILAVGRDASSGTHEVVRESALCDGEFRPAVIAWPGNGAIVGTVARNRAAIGYASIGYVNGLVKPLALARAQRDDGILADAQSVTNGSYPLTRELYFYINRRPGHVLADLPKAFVEYALSEEGQTLVRQEGFVPLIAGERAAQYALID